MIIKAPIVSPVYPQGRKLAIEFADGKASATALCKMSMAKWILVFFATRSYKQRSRRMEMSQKIAFLTFTAFLVVFSFPLSSEGVVNGFDYPVGKPNADGWTKTQPFGNNNPSYGGYHLGEDWAINSVTSEGQSVYAIAEGTVVQSVDTGPSGGCWLNVVILRHTLPDGSQYESLYGHLKSRNYQIGDTVPRGKALGEIGNPSCGGPHLHFEMRTPDCPYWDNHTRDDGYSNTPKPTGWIDPSAFIKNHRAWPQVDAGDHHTVGLRSDGTVLAAGDNSWGSCNVRGWRNIVQIAAGAGCTVGLKSDGTVIAVGDNSWDRLSVDDWSNIIQIAAADISHTTGVKSDGKVVAVGYNEYGQCNVSGWRDIKQVAVGWYHTVGLTADGGVVATGRNSHGQCNVSGWTDIKQIAAKHLWTVGIQSDGTVVAVGHTADLISVSSWRDISQVDVGMFHIVGLRSDGTAIATNAGGSPCSECNVSNWTDIIQIVAGWDHTVGLESDGKVLAVTGETDEWDYGQCNTSSWNLMIPLSLSQSPAQLLLLQ